jgi:hypothetical protein
MRSLAKDGKSKLGAGYIPPPLRTRKVWGSWFDPAAPPKQEKQMHAQYGSLLAPSPVKRVTVVGRTGSRCSIRGVLMFVQR